MRNHDKNNNSNKEKKNALLTLPCMSRHQRSHQPLKCYTSPGYFHRLIFNYFCARQVSGTKRGYLSRQPQNSATIPTYEYMVLYRTTRLARQIPYLPTYLHIHANDFHQGTQLLVDTVLTCLYTYIFTPMTLIKEHNCW